MVLSSVKRIVSMVYMKYILKKEKKYTNNECELTYLFIRKKRSDKLLVIFSGFPGAGKKPVYNYILKFKNLNCNRLYILDNFGYDSRGSYYLGENKNFFVERAVTELVEQIIKEHEISKEDVTTVGSSKGGFAALYFSIKNNYGAAISGGPQILLGKYLSLPEHLPILSYVAGGTGTEEIKFMDMVLLRTVKSAKKTPKLYLHVGKRVEEDMMHMNALTNALNEKGINYKLNIEDYDKHSGLGKFFPNYAIQSIIAETTS